MTKTALKAAQRGAAFLDAKLGRGWRRKIRRRRLDMGSPEVVYDSDCGCILAQLYGDYSDGVDALGIHEPDERRLGFDSDYQYDDLTEAWLTVLREKA